MATFTKTSVEFNLPMDEYSPYLKIIGSGFYFPGDDSTFDISIVVDNNVTTITLFGSNFRYGGDNIPDSGTVSAFVIAGGIGQVVTLFDVTGLDMTVQEFYALAQGDILENWKSLFSGSDTIIGNDLNDQLDGYAGADRMEGGFGNDTYFVGDAGDQVIEQGGKGTNDVVKATVSYKLADVEAEGIEALKLVGDGGIRATGNVFDNLLVGNAGGNTLSGLEGNDILRGGGGADKFVFKEAVSLDRIRDFSAIDRIVLDDQLYQDFDHRGRLHANEFKDIGQPGGRVDANDIILYNSNSGAVFYDFNGNTPGGRTHIITLGNKADLNFDDIFIA